VGGTSGSTAASGAAGVDGVRLKLLQAPRKIVSAEAIPRLVIARTLCELVMASPSEQDGGRPAPHPSAKWLSRQCRRNTTPVRNGLAKAATNNSLKKHLTCFA
jgi:hypothetical protein